jgi:hypothetical protein
MPAQLRCQEPDTMTHLINTSSTSTSTWRQLGAALTLAAALASGGPAKAQRVSASDASALSMLPVASVVAAPVMVLSAGAMLTVAAVESTARGSVWVLERASDGARASLQLAGGASAAIGTAVVVTAVSAGWILSAAGQAIAFVPNEIGASLMYNERVTR